jgi:hypothetical protein
MQSNMNTNNASIAAETAKQQGNLLGNVMGGIGAASQMIPGGGLMSMFGGGGGGMDAGAFDDALNGSTGTIAGGGTLSTGGDMIGNGQYMSAEGGKVPSESPGLIDQAVSAVKKAFSDDPKPKAAPTPVPQLDPAKVSGFTKGMGYAEGGPIQGPRSNVGKRFHGVSQMMNHPAAMMAKGGKVPALVSPGELYLDRNAVKQVEQGASPRAVGEKIPGKPKVPGAKNSYANDTVPKDLESGGIVVPRSETQGKNATHKEVSFIAAVQRKQSLKKSK